MKAGRRDIQKNPWRVGRLPLGKNYANQGYCIHSHDISEIILSNSDHLTEDLGEESWKGGARVHQKGHKRASRWHLAKHYANTGYL